jgi:hypothetical protein
MADYIPRTDGEFLTWEQNFLTYAAGHLDELGLLVTDLAPLAIAQTAWEAARVDAEAKQTAVSAAIEVKATTRDTFETAVRALVRRLQASAEVSDDERRALRITVKDGEPTPAGPTATRPMASISTAERFRHEIKFVDAATPNRRAKPAGVARCEIWGKVGEAPSHPSECQLLTMDTSSPAVLEYGPQDLGKVAHYMLRWVSTNGQKGPWSETAAATIVG